MFPLAEFSFRRLANATPKRESPAKPVDPEQKGSENEANSVV
jgi:hypothetical protein